MRQIAAQDITKAVKKMCIEAAFDLGEDVLTALKNARKTESSETGKEIFDQLLENAEVARNERLPLCQDTGVAILFVERGESATVTDGGMYEAITQGVKEGYAEGYLRKSMVAHPLKRVNTGDNTPAIIHTEMVPGDRIKITFMAKGGGMREHERSQDPHPCRWYSRHQEVCAPAGSGGRVKSLSPDHSWSGDWGEL